MLRCLILCLLLAAAASAGDLPTLELEVDLVIGDREDDPLLGRIIQVVEDSRGRILLSDWQQHCVFAFDAEGRFLERLGRGGEGPGEFMDGFRFAEDAGGRFLFAGRGGRLEIVDGDWTPVVSVRHAHPLGAVSSIVPLPNGSLVLAAPDIEGLTILDLYDADHELVRSFSAMYVADDDAPSWTRRTFGAGFVCLSAGGVLHYAQMAPYLLRTFDTDGNLLASSTDGAEGFVPAPSMVKDGEHVTYSVGGAVSNVLATPLGVLVESWSRGDDEEVTTRWCLYDDALTLVARRDFEGVRRLRGLARDGRIWVNGTDDETVTIERATLSLR